ncbi:MAG: hypothetical protein M9894_25210 [Planctomycetes bacterium]|nr:hypothetical protein [Planctomycetota bacterium]
MRDPSSSLLTGDSRERLEALEALLRADERKAPRLLEAALPDLLRDADDALLEGVSRALAMSSEDPAARRLLETLAGRAGVVRAAALRALRGEVTARPSRERPEEAPPAPPSSPAPGPGSEGEAAWTAPFEAALADPTSERLADAALALVELTATGGRLDGAERLAGRLAMAALERAGEAQAGLVRLARGLKALA